VLFAGKSEFAGQLTQGKFPLPILYVPATHLVHVVILTLHCATNPDLGSLSSEVKTTCKYPVDDT